MAGKFIVEFERVERVDRFTCFLRNLGCHYQIWILNKKVVMRRCLIEQQMGRYRGSLCRNVSMQKYVARTFYDSSLPT